MQTKGDPLLPNESFRVEYRLDTDNANMTSTHYHNCYEIYYYLGDTATYFIENKSYPVNTYDVIFVDKFTYHKTWYREGETVERYLMYIGDEVIHMIKDGEIRSKILALFQKKKLSFPGSFNKSMLYELKQNIFPSFSRPVEPIPRLKAQFSLLGLLLSMAELVDRGIVTESGGWTNSKEHRIACIIDYINSHHSSPITLDRLSERFFVSKYYLCHSFNEVTGLSIMDFVTEKRLIEAEKLLRYSDSRVTQISEEVGFQSVSYFISLFKKKYHCTPHAFRKKVYSDNKDI